MNYKYKIAAMTTIFNPAGNVLQNILSYIDCVEKLYIYDNSGTNLFSKKIPPEYLEKVVYFWNGQNDGIAFALNFCASAAIKDGYELLLTMDQDSFFSNESISSFIKLVDNFTLDSIGIFSPFHDMNGYNSNLQLGETSDVFVIATSGNLLNLKIFSELGGFLEKLFIDYVDNEYCIRLKINGYKIVRFNKILMNHNLGELSAKYILGKKFSITHHTPMRLYYRVRNRLFLISKYYQYVPKYSLLILRLIFTDFLKVLVFERQKLLKSKMMFYGFRHFIQNKFGKY